MRLRTIWRGRPKNTGFIFYKINANWNYFAYLFLINIKSNFLFRFPNRNLRAQGGCLGCKERWRTWTICDMSRGADNQAIIREFPNGETFLMLIRNFGLRRQRANGGKWNISVPLGIENNSYFLSSGERNGRSPNQNNYFLFLLWGCRVITSLREELQNRYIIESDWMRNQRGC